MTHEINVSGISFLFSSTAMKRKECLITCENIQARAQTYSINKAVPPILKDLHVIISAVNCHFIFGWDFPHFVNASDIYLFICP